MKNHVVVICFMLAVLASFFLFNSTRSVSATGAIEEARTTNTCTTPFGGGNSCTVSLTWPSSFSDTNYTVVCLPEGGQNPSTAIPPEVFVLPSNKTTTGVKVTIQQVDASVNQQVTLNGVGCVAVHD